MSNQRTIVAANNLFSADNDGRYPASVATIGKGNNWNWNDPRMFKSSDYITGRAFNSIGEYLGDYVDDVRAFSSPFAPQRHRYMDEAWELGDLWDNPDTPTSLDLLIGQYSCYWGYEGLISRDGRRFLGPARQSGGRKYSKLLVSDYLGYGNWRTPGAMGSSRSFAGATVSPEDTTCGGYWYKDGVLDAGKVNIRLHAGFSDGHVETFAAAETVAMWVIMIRPYTPYPVGVGPGIFYLPNDAVR